MRAYLLNLTLILAACSPEFEPDPQSSEVNDEVALCESVEENNSISLNESDIGQIAQALSSPSTLKWWRYAGDVVELQDALDCGLQRWAEATCMSIDISYYPNHWMRQDTAANMNGFSGFASTTDGWATSRIKLEDSMEAEKRCQVAVHEIGHVLRKSGTHPCGTNTMCNSSTSVANSKISQPDLNLVCAKYECLCQIPE
jgi:hypothetical protein